MYSDACTAVTTALVKRTTPSCGSHEAVTFLHYDPSEITILLHYTREYLMLLLILRCGDEFKRNGQDRCRTKVRA